MAKIYWSLQLILFLAALSFVLLSLEPKPSGELTFSQTEKKAIIR